MNQARITYNPNVALYLVALLLCMFDANAQTAFTNASAKLPNQVFYTWLQKGVTDMNADGRDDIVRANAAGEFFILLQNANGTYTEQPLGQVQPFTPLSVILADVDNNGYPDILTGGQYNGIRVVKANANASAYNITRLPQDSIFTQASALADINNDGWLDAFVCNDDSTNGIWKNTGGGNFIKDAIGFDFNSVPLNKHSGNYGIVFTDFDNDGDLDAYLSKCRAGVTDSTDQRRINQFFVNTNGQYIDQAKKYGMADSSQTWVTEFQDIDNDGDLDAFIANHHTPSRLMLNNGSGYFTDITASSGLLGTTPDGILQALMRDFDNDGYVDLIVSGMMGAKYFKNNGNRTFSETDLPLLSVGTDKPLRSFAIGDLNHDGFQDIYASYHYGGREPDVLWLNDKNVNHFMAISLTGTQSNRSAVGARITLKANGQTQIREVRAGESYGISNSLTQYIGLGNNTNIDSIEVKWPSGQRTYVANPTADQFLSITEPMCSNVCVPVTAKIIKL
jgi:hypothetical protein